jgi:hypothetical protein
MTGAQCRRPRRYRWLSRRPRRYRWLGTVLVLTVVPAACAGDEEAGRRSSTRDTPTTTAGPRRMAVADLRRDDCFDEQAVQRDETVEVDRITRLPCDRPHDNQVYAVFRRAAPEETPYPGTERVSADAQEACRARFDGYVGKVYDESELDFSTLFPTRAGWLEGDREVMCVLFRTDQGKITGSMREAMI